MQAKPAIGTSYFVAVGMAVLAWHFAPAAGDPWQLWAMAAFSAGLSAEMFIRTHGRAIRARGLRPARRGLPLWLIAWAVILGLAWTQGTPHLRIMWGPQGCLYYGWNGLVHLPAAPCSVIAMIPVRWTPGEVGWLK